MQETFRKPLMISCDTELASRVDIVDSRKSCGEDFNPSGPSPVDVLKIAKPVALTFKFCHSSYLAVWLLGTTIVRSFNSPHVRWQGA